MSFFHFTKYYDLCSTSINSSQHHPFYQRSGIRSFERTTVCSYKCLLRNICVISNIKSLTVLQRHSSAAIHLCAPVLTPLSSSPLRVALLALFEFSKRCQTVVKKSNTNSHSCNSDSSPVLAAVMIPFHLHDPGRYGGQ